MHYRRDIDGLRALAVVAVLLTHGFKTTFPNGYLGVDVFFVISGFVITASLLSRTDQPLGKFLRSFYGRRFIRLLPALVVVVTASSIAISFFSPYPNVYLKTGLAALFGLGNIQLFLEGQDYFGASSALNPFTHTWSLGVEEQFYLVIPVLLWAGLRAGRTAHTLSSIGVLSVLSLACWLGFSEDQSDATFYLPQFRFWELASGVMACLAMKRFPRTMDRFSNWAGQAVSVLAFATLIVVLILPVKLPMTIGTLFSVAGTIALIAARPRSRWVVGPLLSWPTQSIGGASYAIYLWHWPLLVLGLWTFGGGIWATLFLMSLSILLGLLTTRFIEAPIRFNPSWTPRAPVRLGFATMVAAACVPLGIALSPVPFFLGQHPKLEKVGVTTLSSAIVGRNGGEWAGSDCILASNDEVGKVFDLSKCTLGDLEAAGKRVLVVGNSYTAAFVPMFDRLTESTDNRYSIISSWGASPIAGLPNTTPWSEANKYLWEQVVPSLVAGLESGDAVFLLSDMAYLLPAEPSAKADAEASQLISAIAQYANTLADQGLNLYVLGPLPFARDTKCEPIMATSQWFAPNGSGACSFYTQEETLARQRSIMEPLHKMSEAGQITLVDLMPVFCPGKECTYLGPEKQLLYRDVYSHPSVEAARRSADFAKHLFRSH